MPMSLRFFTTALLALAMAHAAHAGEASGSASPVSLAIDYPPESLALGEQGVVQLRLLIGADGRVKQAEVERSSGFERLDAAALQGLRKQQFNPQQRDGQPEAAWYTVPVRFELPQ